MYVLLAFGIYFCLKHNKDFIIIIIIIIIVIIIIIIIIINV